jgi:hypothetical protein
MSSSPLAQVKERFGDKAKLVAAVQALATEALWLDRLNSEKGLAKVSNAKLLKLHASLSKAKDDFGSRDKLVEAILTLEKRGTDAGLKAGLASQPLPRLLDRHARLTRAAKQSASAEKVAAAKAAPAAKAPRAKKAPKAS